MYFYQMSKNIIINNNSNKNNDNNNINNNNNFMLEAWFGLSVATRVMEQDKEPFCLNTNKGMNEQTDTFSPTTYFIFYNFMF